MKSVTENVVAERPRSGPSVFHHRTGRRNVKDDIPVPHHHQSSCEIDAYRPVS